MSSSKSNKVQSLGARQKSYESANSIRLLDFMPVMVRLDGSAFHTYTKGFDKPFDKTLAEVMWETSKYLCENIPGCKFAYTQSDEITLFINNYETYNQDAWLKNRKTKIESKLAGMASAKFNLEMYKRKPEFMEKEKLAYFDARAFNIPKEEVNNNLIWRQRDATKNSISMLGQANYKQKELQGINGKELQDKLFKEKGINWNDLEVWKKRGVCIVKETYTKGNTIRKKWVVDNDTPIFSQDTNYINKYVLVDTKIKGTLSVKA